MTDSGDGERDGSDGRSPDVDTDSDADAASVVDAYYDALDDHDYETLESLLAPDFTQRRPDRTFDGRDAFVRFMRDGRPLTDTRHEVLEVLVDEDEPDRATVRGRLRDSDDEVRFDFADVFTVEHGEIVRLETYTR